MVCLKYTVDVTLASNYHKVKLADLPTLINDVYVVTIF
jgi:hypothetical protein